MYPQNLRSILDLTSFYNQVFWKFLEDLPLQYRDNPSSVSLKRFQLCKFLLLAEISRNYKKAQNHPPGPRNPWHLSKCLRWELVTGLHGRSPNFCQKSPPCYDLLSVSILFVEPCLSIWVIRRPCWSFFLTKVKFSSISSRIYFLSFLFSSNSVWVFLIYRNIKSLNERIFWFEARSRAPQFD